MKKFTYAIFAIAFALLVSCSDDDQNSGGGELRISGQVFSPNNAFPISRATVKVFRGDDMIAQETTDALGNFVVDEMPEGDLRVVLSKGKFSRTIDINLQEDYTIDETQRNFDTFPKIAVVQGSYDYIEEILMGIGVVDPATGAPAFDFVSGVSGRANAGKHAHANVTARPSNLTPNVAFGIAELLNTPDLLATYDIIFFNCSVYDELHNSPAAMDNLRDFVDNGGIIYATDWMYTYVQSMFPTDYLNFAQPEKSGDSSEALATLGSADLEAWLEAQGITVTPNVLVEGFLGGWQLVDSFNPENVDAWVIATQVQYDNQTLTDKPLAFTFPYGCGGVFYSSFHTHGNLSASDAIDQMMSYFVFELSGLGSECGQGN